MLAHYETFKTNMITIDMKNISAIGPQDYVRNYWVFIIDYRTRKYALPVPKAYPSSKVQLVNIVQQGVDVCKD